MSYVIVMIPDLRGICSEGFRLVSEDFMYITCGQGGWERCDELGHVILCRICRCRSHCRSQFAQNSRLFASMMELGETAASSPRQPQTAPALSDVSHPLFRGSCGSDKAACLKEKVCALSSDPKKSEVC